jgi:hypothetical protein
MKRSRKYELSQKREEQLIRNARHHWQVGELCNTTYGGIGQGTIYRVVEVIDASQRSKFSHPTDKELKIVPVFGIINDIEARKSRNLGAAWCSPLSIIDLAMEYAKFGLFISDETKRLNNVASTTEPSSNSTNIPSRSTYNVERRIESYDDFGLCSDISSRSE